MSLREASEREAEVFGVDVVYVIESGPSSRRPRPETRTMSKADVDNFQGTQTALREHLGFDPEIRLNVAYEFDYTTYVVYPAWPWPEK
jgi:hypothetical protein